MLNAANDAEPLTGFGQTVEHRDSLTSATSRGRVPSIIPTVNAFTFSATEGSQDTVVSPAMGEVTDFRLDIVRANSRPLIAMPSYSQAQTYVDFVWSEYRRTCARFSLLSPC
jgi:hypothetical protein